MTPDGWVADATAGAPAALGDRARAFFRRADGNDLAARCAAAGRAALVDATRGESGRGAALDLLAADALITLALLATSETDASSLGVVARALRDEVTGR